MEGQAVSITLLDSEIAKPSHLRAFRGNLQEVSTQISSRSVSLFANANRQADCRLPSSAGQVQHTHARSRLSIINECVRYRLTHCSRFGFPFFGSDEPVLRSPTWFGNWL